MNLVSKNIPSAALLCLVIAGACSIDESSDDYDIGSVEQGIYTYYECNATVKYDPEGPGTETKSFAKNAGKASWCKNKIKNKASSHCWSITEWGLTEYYSTSATYYQVTCNDDQGGCSNGDPVTWYFSGSCEVDGDPL